MFTVYAHRNRTNGKRYVGFTSRSERERWREHVSDARARRGMCRKFHNAIRKYGEDCWDTELVYQGTDKDEALRQETAAIVRFGSIRNGYNITRGGDFGTLGLKMSAATRRKLSERQRGEKNHRYGYVPPPEERAAHAERMRQWHAANVSPNKGRPASVETRAKMSAAHKGEGNAFYGRRHSEETKRGLSVHNAMRGAWGWMNPCTQANPPAMAIYARAVAYHSWWLRDRRGADVMCRVFGEKRRKPHLTLIERFRAGWMPTEDAAWLAHFQPRLPRTPVLR